MNNKIYISVIKTSVILFSLVVTFLSFALLAEEPDSIQPVIKKTASIDGFYIELMSARDTNCITPDQRLCYRTRTTGTNDIRLVWYGESWLVLPFRVSDFFEITKPGNYNFQIRFQMAAWVVEPGTTNKTYKIIRFPALDFPITKP